MNLILFKLKQLFENKNFYIFVYISIFILFFFVMKDRIFLSNNDDEFHRTVAERYGSITNFLKVTYNEWSGRFFTNFVMVNIINKNIWIWRILNALCLTMLIVYFAKIIKCIYNFSNKIYILILFASMAVYFYLDQWLWLESVCWASGAFNYLWSTSALIISLYFLINSELNKSKIKLYQFILLIPIVIYASNAEQSGLIFISFAIIAIIYSFIKYKYIDKYVILLVVIGCITLLIVLLSPGVANRYIQEIPRFYPNFNDLSLFTKFSTGLSHTVLWGFLQYNYMTTILFSFLIIIFLYKQKANIIYILLSLIPFIYSLIYYLLGQINGSIRTSLLFDVVQYSYSALKHDVTDTAYIFTVPKYALHTVNYTGEVSILPVVIGIVVILTMFFLLFKIKWSNFERKWLAIIFFTAGLLSSLTLCFSPTIFASSWRIFLIPFTMYILTTIIIFADLIEKRYINLQSKSVICILVVYICLSIVDLFNKI